MRVTTIISLGLIIISFLAFFLSFCNFPIPMITSFQEQQISALLENRIRDMITTFVLSLTIVIFSINAIKNLNLPTEKYDELIEDSYTIPLMVFLAFNLFLALLTSYLFNELVESNDFTIYKLLSLIYYLLVLDIVFIVFVFIRVFKILNPNFLLERVFRNYILNLKRNRDTSRNKADIELLIDMAIRNNDMRFFNRILDIFYNNYGNR